MNHIQERMEMSARRYRDALSASNRVLRAHVDRACKIEVVDRINNTVRYRGDWCSHATSRGSEFYHFTTDGEVVDSAYGRTVATHENHYHVGCCMEPTVHTVHGGTYILEALSSLQTSMPHITKIVVASNVQLATIQAIEWLLLCPERILSRAKREFLLDLKFS